jgi:hypothetical protein
MSESLQEFCDSRGVKMRVDRASGVLHGVKILGLKSRNGRSYSPDALKTAAALYEQAKVNVNHPKGHPASPRDYQDRLGQIRGVEFRVGEGLFGDLHFNPKHALAEQLLWDAEHAPENVGFSHNVEARTVRRGEEVVVEAIARVQSVDLVADPATTRGLFESVEAKDENPQHSDLAELKVSRLTSGRPDLSDESFASETNSASMPKYDLAELEKNYPGLIGQLSKCEGEEIRRLREEIEELSLEVEAHKFQQMLSRLFREHGLPSLESSEPGDVAILSETFLSTLLDTGDEATLRKRIADRAKLVEAMRKTSDEGPRLHIPANKPIAREQNLRAATNPGDVKSFVAAIT